MTATGLPRPRRKPSTDGQPLPVPWINGGEDTAPDEVVDFLAFRGDCRRAETERLCCICGDPLRSVVVIGAYKGNRETSGGWGHPVCLGMAMRMCPHFDDFEAKGRTVFAWRYEGPRTGIRQPARFETDTVIVRGTSAMSRAEVLELAKLDPWGNGELGRKLS